MRVTKISGGNPKTMRRLNRCLVVETIRQNGSFSRSDIADATNLSRTAITNLVNELLKEGTIRENATINAGRGRGKVMLEIDKAAGVSIGLELADERIEGVLVNLKGEVIRSYKIECVGDHVTEEIINLLVQSIENLVNCFDGRRENTKGIGIAIQGLVDPQKGISFSVPFLENWKDVQLKRILEEKLNIPVLMDCRIFAATLAEMWYGAGREVSDFLYVSIGTGVALGIVSGGKILRGTVNSAGQFGHMTVVNGGRRCFCGNYGCLETVSSTKALRERAVDALKSGVESSMKESDHITFGEIVKAAKNGDKLAVTLLEETGEYLGVGIADLVNLFNPALIVIGGEIVQAGDIVLDSIKRSARAKSVGTCFQSTKIRFSTLHQESAPSLGAATMILHKHFEIPEIMVPEVKWK